MTCYHSLREIQSGQMVDLERGTDADTSGDYWDVGPLNHSAKRTVAAIRKQALA